MSATDVTTRASLKRKLEEADADLPSSKRRKLNHLNDGRFKIIIDGHTLQLDSLSDKHAAALQDTLLTLRCKFQQQNNSHLENVLTDTLITQLSRFAPISLEHLTHFDEMNDANISDVGEQLISVISDYIRSHSLQSPFQIYPSTVNTFNGTKAVQNTNIPSSESAESEQTIQPKPQKKHFIDSESEDDDDISDTTASKPKFVHGEHIASIGHKIPDVVDKNEEEASDEDQDNDLNCLFVETLETQTRAEKCDEIDIGIGSEMLIGDGDVDLNQNPLHSYELHKVKKIEQGVVFTRSYEEIDVTTNDDYYIVDRKCKFKKGQWVASRWPENLESWRQYYVGSIIGLHVDEHQVWRYNVMFHDGPCVVTKLIALRMDRMNQQEQDENTVQLPAVDNGDLALICADESIHLLLEAADNVMIDMW